MWFALLCSLFYFHSLEPNTQYLWSVSCNSVFKHTGTLTGLHMLTGTFTCTCPCPCCTHTLCADTPAQHTHLHAPHTLTYMHMSQILAPSHSHFLQPSPILFFISSADIHGTESLSLGPPNMQILPRWVSMLLPNFCSWIISQLRSKIHWKT